MDQVIPTEHLERIKHAFSDKKISEKQISYLSKGANNIIYRIDFDNRILTAKLGVNNAFRFLDKEFLFLSHVKGIGPQVITYNEYPEDGSQLLVLEYIDGAHPYKLDPDMLIALGRKISSYHYSTIQLPELPHETWTDFISKRIEPMISTDKITELSKDALKKINSLKALGNSLYSKFDISNTAIVHGDLIPLNILVNNHMDFFIIDWEGVRYDEPESDLATLIKAYRMTDSQISTILDGYSNPVNLQILWFRLILHYLQVFTWRASVQIPKTSDIKNCNTLTEALEELTEIDRLMDAGPDHFSKL